MPGATAPRSWVTAYFPVSAVPSVRQGPLPICAAKLTRLKPPSVVAPTVTGPVDPSAGGCTESRGAAATGASFPAALNTTEDSAGTVTVTLRSPPLVTRSPADG